MLVVHEGVLYRETSLVEAWFLVSEAIDRSWCLRLHWSPLRRGLLRWGRIKLCVVATLRVNAFQVICGAGRPLWEWVVVDLVGSE